MHRWAGGFECPHFCVIGEAPGSRRGALLVPAEVLGLGVEARRGACLGPAGTGSGLMCTIESGSGPAVGNGIVGLQCNKRGLGEGSWRVTGGVEEGGCKWAMSYQGAWGWKRCSMKLLPGLALTM